MTERFTVSFTVELDEKNKKRLFEMAEETGQTFDDAGKNTSIRRLFVDVGLEGAFPDDHQLGLNFEIHNLKSPGVPGYIS